MRLREVGWGIFLVGLPFSHLLFQPQLDIWHSHSLWAHLWISILIGATFWKQETVIPRSKALGCLVTWLFISWIWQWNMTIFATKTYPIGRSMGMFHLISILMFYIACTSSLQIYGFAKIMKWMARATWVIVAYCVLQYFSLDQFFQNLNFAQEPNDVVVGTIGNPTHLASHLSLLLPVVLIQKGWSWRVLTLILIFMLVMLKSVAGAAAATVAIMVWFWPTKRWVSLSVSVLALSGAVYAYFNTDWFNDRGRYQAWSAFWQIFSNRPITGYGAGFVMNLSHGMQQGSPIFQWRHIHMELFQAAMEWGVVGMGFLCWFLVETCKDIGRIIQNPIGRACMAMFAAFFVNCLLNFSAHLWVTGSLGLFAICGIRVISEEYGYNGSDNI